MPKRERNQGNRTRVNDQTGKTQATDSTGAPSGPGATEDKAPTRQTPDENNIFKSTLGILLTTLDRAVKAVPAAVYFYGVVAAGVAVAIIGLLNGLNRVTFVAIFATFVATVVFYAFSSFVTKSADKFTKAIGYLIIASSALAYVFVIVISGWLAIKCGPAPLAYLYGLAEVCQRQTGQQEAAKPLSVSLRDAVIEWISFDRGEDREGLYYKVQAVAEKDGSSSDFCRMELKIRGLTLAGESNPYDGNMRGPEWSFFDAGTKQRIVAYGFEDMDRDNIDDTAEARLVCDNYTTRWTKVGFPEVFKLQSCGISNSQLPKDVCPGAEKSERLKRLPWRRVIAVTRANGSNSLFALTSFKEGWVACGHKNVPANQVDLETFSKMYSVAKLRISNDDFLWLKADAFDVNDVSSPEGWGGQTVVSFKCGDKIAVQESLDQAREAIKAARQRDPPR